MEKTMWEWWWQLVSLKGQVCPSKETLRDGPLGKCLKLKIHTMMLDLCVWTTLSSEIHLIFINKSSSNFEYSRTAECGCTLRKWPIACREIHSIKSIYCIRLWSGLIVCGIVRHGIKTANTQVGSQDVRDSRQMKCKMVKFCCFFLSNSVHKFRVLC